MKLAFLGGALDHICLPICESFHSLLGDNFIFVSSKPRSSSRTDLGYDSLNDKYPFVIKWYENEKTALDIINNADVVIYGSAPESIIRKRMLQNKLTFRFTERLYKEPFNFRNFFRRLCGALIHHGIYQGKNVHILCAGAYVATDFKKYNFYRDRFYKWCYFTQITDKSYNDLCKIKKDNKKVELIWTARFIPVKKPNLVIELAQYLKERNIDFHINMVGGGELLDTVKKDAISSGIEDFITFTGPISPESVREIMESADISLFTSDRREGWGAVLNEAMGCGCACVASSAAGSSPFLIKHNKNGVLFDINNKEDFFAKVYNLICDKKKIAALGKTAYEDIHNFWTPSAAAKSFLKLAKSILNNLPTPAEYGPCSIAPVLKDGWNIDEL